jgi:hypothetical protein
VTPYCLESAGAFPRDRSGVLLSVRTFPRGSLVNEWICLADVPSESPTRDIGMLVRVWLSNAIEIPTSFDCSGSEVSPSYSFVLMSSVSATLNSVVTSIG